MNINVDNVFQIVIIGLCIRGAFAYSRYREICRNKIAQAVANEKERQETIAKLDGVLPTMAKLLSPLANKPFEYQSCDLNDQDFIVKFSRRD